MSLGRRQSRSSRGRGGAGRADACLGVYRSGEVSASKAGRAGRAGRARACSERGRTLDFAGSPEGPEGEGTDVIASVLADLFWSRGTDVSRRARRCLPSLFSSDCLGCSGLLWPALGSTGTGLLGPLWDAMGQVGARFAWIGGHACLLHCLPTQPPPPEPSPPRSSRRRYRNQTASHLEPSNASASWAV